MGKSAPLRVDEGVYQAAKAAGDRHSRSTAEQVSYWAKLGRALEASDVTVAGLAAVLDGRVAYDDAEGATQVLVRAAWRDGIRRQMGELDLASAVEGEGGTAVWVTDDGRIAQRPLAGPASD